MTDIPYEKRYCLLEAAKTALKLADGDSLELSRRLFREYLAQYPDSLDVEVGNARMGIVKTYLAGERREEALRTLREFDKAAARGVDVPEGLLTIAKAHLTAKDYPNSLKLFQEIVERFPRSDPAFLAYLWMGDTYEKLDDEKKMIAAYEAAAEIRPAGAIQRLAKYYMEKQQWDEALRWWQTEKRASWYGQNGAREAENIAICLIHLGRHRDAAQLCLDAMADEALEHRPTIAALLFRLYRDADQLADLERMVEAFEDAILAEFDKQGYLKRKSRKKRLQHAPSLHCSMCRVCRSGSCFESPNSNGMRRSQA